MADMSDVNLVTLLQLKSTSERIAAMISGLLTDEEVASLVDDTELAAAVNAINSNIDGWFGNDVTLRLTRILDFLDALTNDHTAHNTSMVNSFNELKGLMSYSSAEEASF